MKTNFKYFTICVAFFFVFCILICVICSFFSKEVTVLLALEYFGVLSIYIYIVGIVGSFISEVISMFTSKI